MPHELLLLTTKQTTKIRIAFANNMLTDIKHTKAQISKIIQAGGSFDSRLRNLGKKALTNISIRWARDKLPELVSNLTLHAINKLERWKRSCESKKKIYFIYFEWRCEWYYWNYKMIWRFGCTNWWSYWNSKT